MSLEDIVAQGQVTSKVAVNAEHQLAGSENKKEYDNKKHVREAWRRVPFHYVILNQKATPFDVAFVFYSPR